MSELRRGQKVRVSYEAEYDRSHGADGTRVTFAEFGYWVPDGATIEPIEDLQLGDVYRDALGHLIAYSLPHSETPWLSLGIGQFQSDAFQSRPLTLLVRNGQPVTS